MLEPPVDEATTRHLDVGLVIPSDGIAIIRNAAELDYSPPDGYEPFVDQLTSALEAGGYERDPTIGSPLTFVSDDPSGRGQFRSPKPSQASPESSCPRAPSRSAAIDAGRPHAAWRNVAR